MSEHDPVQNGELDRYLDDQMDAAERRAFEALLREDESLREVIEQSARIDASLHRYAREPESLAAWTPSTDLKRPVGSWDVRQVVMAMAAAVVLTLSVTYVVVFLIASGPVERSFPASIDVAAVYSEQLEPDFEPGWVCDPPTLAYTTRQTLGAAVLLDESAYGVDGARLAGVSTLATSSGSGIAVHGWVGDKAVLVIIDRDEDQRVGVYEGLGDGGYRVFRKSSGGLVFLELTQLSESVFLEAMEVSGGRQP